MQTRWPQYKELRQDAQAHPWTWCSRIDLPGTRVRYIPETRTIETELTDVHETITGELVMVTPGVIVHEQLPS